MREKLLLLFFVLVSSVTLSHAQDIRQKLGKPSDYELKMTVFPADTAAAAVVLSQNTRIYYEMSTPGSSSGLFNLVHEYEVRVKVLKPEGTKVANIEIPYYDMGEAKEQVRGISATAYNMEGAKTVKTVLNRKDIFDEMASKNIRLKKFSIPDVRVGTVIEYKYSITSNILHHIRDVEIQGDYPVLLSTGEITIPKIFRYHINTTGYHRFEVERKPSYVAIAELYKEAIGDEAETVRFSLKDVPTLKSEPNVWYPDDFRSKMTVEISGLVIPGIVYQDYSSSWSVIDDQLEKSDFGRNLKMSCPLADEVKQLTAQADDRIGLARDILKLVTSRIKWDKTYRLSADNIRRDLREGSGSSASVNFILNSALRQAGFETIPILLNPRNMGRMPITHATLTNINTFVIAVQTEGDNMIVLDATDQDNDVNVIPPAVMVDRAKFYGSGNGSQGWVNLSNPSANFAISQVACEFNDDMELVASVTSSKTNLHSLLTKRRYRSAASEEEYIEEMETRNDMLIEDYKISDLSQKDIIETYRFRMTPSGAGDFIYVNATVIPFMSESVFKQQQRKLPVEFPYMEGYEINCRIKIPEGYEVEELPASERITIPDSSIIYQYSAAEQDGEIVITMQYVVNRIIFTVDEYPMLFEIYGHIASKSNSNIVLKKI